MCLKHTIEISCFGHFTWTKSRLIPLKQKGSEQELHRMHIIVFQPWQFGDASIPTIAYFGGGWISISNRYLGVKTGVPFFWSNPTWFSDRISIQKSVPFGNPAWQWSINGSLVDDEKFPIERIAFHSYVNELCKRSAVIPARNQNHHFFQGWRTIVS